MNRFVVSPFAGSGDANTLSSRFYSPPFALALRRTKAITNSQNLNCSTIRCLLRYLFLCFFGRKRKECHDQLRCVSVLLFIFATVTVFVYGVTAHCLRLRVRLIEKRFGTNKHTRETKQRFPWPQTEINTNCLLCSFASTLNLILWWCGCDRLQFGRSGKQTKNNPKIVVCLVRHLIALYVSLARASGQG